MSYRKIRFIGYAIPTTPADFVAIGNPYGPGAVAGTYLAKEDFDSDFEHRLQILKNAVDTAKSQIPEGETDVVNLFVAPEFFFHGPLGPYVYSDPSLDPVTQMTVQLAATFNETEYPNWTFVCGTAVTSQIRFRESVPLAPDLRGSRPSRHCQQHSHLSAQVGSVYQPDDDRKVPRIQR